MRSAVALGMFALLTACSSGDGEIGAAPLPTEEIDASVDAVVNDVTAPIDAPVDETEPTDAAPTTDTGAAADAKVDAGSTCKERLASAGVTFTTTMARGVVDAIKLSGPIHGVLFASGTNTTPMGDPIACDFAHTLIKFADLAKSKGFVRVGTLGSYCYRCCCSWSSTNYCRTLSDPEPDCSANGYSNHSWGRAIDIRYLYKADGTRYDINDDRHWTKYSTTETCTKGVAAQTGISKELYTFACEATQQKIFGVLLTPNYNSAHRNHWHADIGQKGTPTSWTTKSFDPNANIDDAIESCGDE